MSDLLVVALAAAGAGCSLAGAVFVSTRAPSGPDLAAAVVQANRSAGQVPDTSWLARITTSLSSTDYAKRLGPSLELVGLNLAGLVSQALTGALVLALFGAILPILLAVLGIHSAAYLTPVGALLGGAFGVLLAFSNLKKRAEVKRRHLRQAFAGFVSLTALAVAGQMGLESALAAASRVSDDWVFAEIAKELKDTRQKGKPAYAALERIGQRYGETEIVSVATTLRQSDESGSSLRTTLDSKAQSIREARAANLEADAGKMTEKLFMPTSVMFIGYLIFLAYPALAHILGFL
ncbi:MAG: type II secretion system F family protein [Acidimicrobiales bacterium]